MKQFTDAVQTARLIDLGFPAPKSASKLSLDIDMDTIPSFAYSIGELIEMLPPRVSKWDLDIWHDFAFERWVLCFDPRTQNSAATELIDAIYNLIVKLKEEKII